MNHGKIRCEVKYSLYRSCVFLMLKLLTRMRNEPEEINNEKKKQEKHYIHDLKEKR